MSLSSRLDLYAQIEKQRGHPLISYVTSKRDGMAALMATDALPHIIKQLDELDAKVEKLDFLIASYGGDPMVAWRIMSLIRQRVKHVTVIIPQSAYSAATVVALGANEIIMHPNGHLGPVDMQITTVGDTGRARRFSTEDITAFLDFVRDNLKITDQEHIRMLFEMTCKEVGSLGIGFTTRSSRLAVDLGERLLGLHMKDDDSHSKLRTIVENMSRKFHSHAYPVSRKEAIELGLPIKEDADVTLNDLIWKLWLDIEEELKENVPFNPLYEVMNSAEASKLCAPVPQLPLPMNAGYPNYFNTNMTDVNNAATVTVAPVDFSCDIALVESSRTAYACVTRGKILSCRTPDLRIHYNAVTTFAGWEKREATSTPKIKP